MNSIFSNIELIKDYINLSSKTDGDICFIFNINTYRIEYITKDYCYLFNQENLYYSINNVEKEIGIIKKAKQFITEISGTGRYKLSFFIKVHNVSYDINAIITMTFEIENFKYAICNIILQGSKQDKFNPTLYHLISNTIYKFEEGTFKKDIKQNNSFNLTKRETQVLFLFIKGLTLKEIAIILNISYSSVRKYIEYIHEKLHIHNSCEIKDLLLK